MIMRLKKGIIALLWMGTPLGVMLWLRFFCGMSLLINTTHSLPHTVYISFGRLTSCHLKAGDYVMFSHHAAKVPVVKRVIGVFGDHITFLSPSAIRVNEGKILPLKSKDSLGNPLLPLQESCIPKNQLFVAGDHQESFDSRYARFGLIDVGQVRGVVWPLL